jgi:UDP-N-acetylmuramoylalanine-D-glutamate ligase
VSVLEDDSLKQMAEKQIPPLRCGMTNRGWGVELSVGDGGGVHPQIAVVLNITPDHLDRHGTFENYAAMKARITARQTAEDFLVLNGEDKPTQMVARRRRRRCSGSAGGRPIKQGAFVHGESVLFVPREGAKAEPVMPVAEIPLRGAHNVENVLAAVCAARLAGLRGEHSRVGARASRRWSIGWSLWRGARRGVL